MHSEEIIAFDGDEIKRFNVTQLREVRELFHRYDHANFTHDEDEELDAFHNFCEEMAKYSPEALDVASPFLN
tara:strand:+ start:3219 stop:3434 length:216 start_codon:yes stop_codon:yes gene_type:complete